MKRIIPFLSALLLAGTAQQTQAQLDLVADQNPQYAVSRDKYMKMADSINTWHSTTEQETYKAIDYLADKREAREARQALRRELRERYGWSYDHSYAPSRYYGRNSYYYGNRPYYGYRSRNYLWGSIPLAFALGLWCR